MRDIQHHLASTLSAGAQRGDHFEDHRRGSRCCPACGSTRPLEESSSRWSTAGAIRADGPRLFTGSPPARPISRSGRGMDGCQARGLSIWAPGPRREPPSGHMCAPVPAQPQRRGVSDRRGGTSRTGAKRAGECDGLTGLPEAIEATWPQATSPPVWSTRFRALDAVRVLRGLPEGRGRSQGRSAPPRARRPLGRL